MIVKVDSSLHVHGGMPAECDIDWRTHTHLHRSMVRFLFLVVCSLSFKWNIWPSAWNHSSMTSVFLHFTKWISKWRLGSSCTSVTSCLSSLVHVMEGGVNKGTGGTTRGIVAVLSGTLCVLSVLSYLCRRSGRITPTVWSPATSQIKGSFTY